MGGQSGDILCAATIEAILYKDIPRTSGLRGVVVDQCHCKALRPETTFGADEPGGPQAQNLIRHSHRSRQVAKSFSAGKALPKSATVPRPQFTPCGE